MSGEITGVTDGAGRHFQLVLTTQAQRAEEDPAAGHFRRRNHPLPDTLPVTRIWPGQRHPCVCRVG
ncbi:hypothetical protein ACNKHU_24780 [Shigella flexneri]